MLLSDAVPVTKNLHIAAGWSRLLHDTVYGPAIQLVVRTVR